MDAQNRCLICRKLISQFIKVKIYMSTDAQKFWDARFDTNEFLFGAEPNEFLKEASSKYLSGSLNVLCVADGEGRNSVFLAKQGFRVTAFDISPIAIEKSKKLSTGHNLNLKSFVADCDSWRWEEHSYDVVVAIFIQFAEPAMRKRLFKNMISSLKPGGILLLEGYTPKQLEYKTGGPGNIDNLYTKVMILELLSGLRIVEFMEHEKELNEGSHHKGRSALMDVIAIKPN